MARPYGSSIVGLPRLLSPCSCMAEGSVRRRSNALGGDGVEFAPLRVRVITVELGESPPTTRVHE